MNPAPAVSVVLPVFRNREHLGELHRRLRAAVSPLEPVELVFVNDACPDGSIENLRQLAAADPHVRVIALERRRGQQGALRAGLVEARGRVIVTMDADLQDPPEAIPVLVAKLSEGYGAVYAGRRGRYESAGRMMSSWIFKHLMARLTGMPPDAGAFVAMTRDVVHSLLRDDGRPYLTAAISQVGHPVVSIPVERAVRPAGRSAFSSAMRLQLGLRALAHAVSSRLIRSGRSTS